MNDYNNRNKKKRKHRNIVLTFLLSFVLALQTGTPVPGILAAEGTLPVEEAVEIVSGDLPHSASEEEAVSLPEEAEALPEPEEIPEEKQIPSGTGEGETEEEASEGGYIDMPWDHNTPEADPSLTYEEALEGIVSDPEEGDAGVNWINPDAPSDLPVRYPLAGADSEILTWLKDRFPETRNQSPYGSCWAHSACALAEFYLIAHGLGDIHDTKVTKTINLSELALAYFCYHQSPPGITGDTGDRVIFYPDAGERRNFLDFGGNLGLAAPVLLRYTGYTADSGDAAYSNAASVLSGGLADEYARDKDLVRLKNEYRINIHTNPELVKQAIRENGIVGISFHTGGSSRSAYWNDSTNAFYNYSNTNTNHAVAIVGWDDTFPAAGFKRTPPRDGAWLMRNSWSTETNMNFNSYFWLSYCDTSLADTAYVFETAESTEEYYDYNYNYDSQFHSANAYNISKTANVFRVMPTEKPLQVLKAVQLDVTGSAGVSYQVEIYTGLKDRNKPTSGTLQEGAVTGGTLPFAGRYTISLNEPVYLEPGDTFSVVASTDGGSVDIEYGYLWYDQVDMKVAVNPGESFYEWYGSWLDATELSYGGTYGNFCIRALVNDVKPDRNPAVSDFTLQTEDVTYDGQPHSVSPCVVVPEIAKRGITVSYASVSEDGTVREFREEVPVRAGIWQVGITTKITEHYYPAAVTSENWRFTVRKAENPPGRPAQKLRAAKSALTVADVPLPALWKWKETDMTKPLSCTEEIIATAEYTGEDRDNFENVSVTATLIRSAIEEPDSEELLKDAEGGLSYRTVRLEGGDHLETTVSLKDVVLAVIETDPYGNETVKQSKIWAAGLSENFVYTGSVIKPAFRLYDGVKLLKEKTDYTVSYKKNKIPGTAEIIVSFRGSYSGTERLGLDFGIEPALLGRDVWLDDVGIVEKEGKKQKPVPVIYRVSDRKKLSAGLFDISYDRDVCEPGEYTIWVRPKQNNANFSGSVSVSCVVSPNKARLMQYTVADPGVKSFYYTGEPIVPELLPGEGFLSTCDGTKLQYMRDYVLEEIRDNTEPGTATMVFRAKDRHGEAGYGITMYGTRVFQFKILKGRKLLPEGQDDGTCSFRYEVENNGVIPYAKGGAKPSVRVWCNSCELVPGVDFTLSYKNNNKVAGADAVNSGGSSIAPTVVVRGKGKFKGSVNLPFSIIRQSLKNTEIYVDDKVENKKGYQNPAITVYDPNGKKLVWNKDYVTDGYTVSGNRDPETVEAGSPSPITITLKAKAGSCYEEETSADYRYIRADQNIAKAKASKISDQTYTGRPLVLKKTDLENILYFGSASSHTEDLIPEKDFVVDSRTYANNEKKGTAKVTVRGIAPYGGKKTLSFRILQKTGQWQGRYNGGEWK